MENTEKPSIIEGFNDENFKRIQSELIDSLKEAREAAVGWYKLLPAEDKMKAVQGILAIICDAERKQCSHRGLQSALDLYPEGFWIDELMTVHNALYTEFNKTPDLEYDV